MVKLGETDVRPLGRSRRPLLVVLLMAFGLLSCRGSPAAGGVDAAAVQRLPPDASVAAAVEGEDAASGPAAEWAETSLHGTFVLKQYRTGQRTCRLECVRASDSQTRWVTELCAATRDQLVFLSDDGDRFLVLDLLPEFEPGAMLRAEVGRAYLMGTVERTVKAASVLADPEKLRRVGGRYLWLAGVRGEEGRPPALVAEGVRISTLDGLERSLRFDGSVHAVEPDAGPRDLPAAEPLDASAPVPRAPTRAELEAEAEAAAEAKWRARFKEVGGRVAALEKEVEETRARAESIERDGLPEFAPQPRIYDPAMTLAQRNQAQAIERAGYLHKIAEQLQETKQKLADAESRLQLAREELEELERKARLEAVPREWRR